MLTNQNAKKEEFSYAYVHTVASVAGYSVEIKRRLMDNAGIDLTIEVPGEMGEVLFPKFDAQVKCTSSLEGVYENYISFSLKAKNYNRLVHLNPLVPQLLILVIVPEDLNEWLNVCEEGTLIKKCSYWMSLKGEPLTQNSSNITVKIPKKKLFTPYSLELIMEKISNGEEL